MLIEKGVPWHEVWSMSPARRMAMIVTFGELSGGTWDWDKLKWLPRA